MIQAPDTTSAGGTGDATKRFVWFSDTHLNLPALPFLRQLFMLQFGLAARGSTGMFLTGDISSGMWLESDLRFLARTFPGPIYFVLGNHDYHWRSIEGVHNGVRRVCARRPNLHWLTDEPVVHLSDDTALIGTEGWYDCQNGDERWLRYTSDWFLTWNFFRMRDMRSRIVFWNHMANRSAWMIQHRLERALEDHDTVYLLTHVPPWPEATSAIGTRLESYWLPYNTNVVMGQAIERVMKNRPDKRVVVLAGHTHIPCHVRITDNVECLVARSSPWGRVRPEQMIML